MYIMAKMVKFAVVLSLTGLMGCSSPMDAFIENSNEYILENSAVEKLSEDELEGMSKEQLEYAKNEIYARHGKIFDDEVYNKYIADCNWYKPDPNFNEDDLSVTENYNLRLIEQAIEENYPETTTEEPTTQATTLARYTGDNYTYVPPEPEVDSNNDYSEIAALLTDYGYALCNAINYGNYSYVSGYIAAGSALERDQRSLVSRLYSKGTMESFGGIVINSISYINDNTCNVNVSETETIYYSDGREETNTYNWTYTAVKNGGIWQLSNIA